MDREEILRRSRAEKEDEGATFLEGRAEWAPAAAAAGALALAGLDLLPPADWPAALEDWAALPWGGPLWWLLRAALALAGDVF